MAVAQLAIGQIRSRDAAAYIVFQLAGGVLAGLLVLLVLLSFHDAGASANYGATAIDPKSSPAGRAGSVRPSPRAPTPTSILGPVIGALLAAVGYRALVLER